MLPLIPNHNFRALGQGLCDEDKSGAILVQSTWVQFNSALVWSTSINLIAWE